MSIQAKYTTSNSRVVEILEVNPHSVYDPDVGEAIADITNFANVGDVPNAVRDYVVTGSDLVYTPIVPTTEQQTLAKRTVDRIAENARLRHITGGAGQATTYVYKTMECQKYKDAGYLADLTGYAWIQAEMAATGGTATQVADSILALAATWVTVGSTIEVARRTGKIAIDTAASITDMEAARDTAVTALDAI